MKRIVLSLIFLTAAIFTGCKTSSHPSHAVAAPPAKSVKSTNAPAPAATPAPAAAPAPTANAAADTNLLNNAKARESYALGMYFGTGWKRSGVDVDLDLLLRGIKDAQGGGATLLDQQQMMGALNDLRQSVQASHQRVQQEEGEQNLKEGQAFLAQNKTQPGVVTLPDGLQYKVLKEGTGKSPEPNDQVTVNYRGSFINGTVFDSSDRAHHPITFPVRGVIHGWTEALERMKVGSKWELFIPSDLAYGPMGRGQIGPNQTLIFDVELLSIEPPPSAPPPAQPLTSDIIKVPSAEEMKKGAKIETIKASDLERMQQAATNSAASTNQ